MLTFYQPTQDDLTLDQAVDYVRREYPKKYALYAGLGYTTLRGSLESGAEFDGARRWICQAVTLSGSINQYTPFFDKHKLDKWLQLPSKGE
jgi:hypothetical protein